MDLKPPTEQSRPGRKRKLDGKAEALLVATACSMQPGRQEWTMQLLAERLVQLQVVDGILTKRCDGL